MVTKEFMVNASEDVAEKIEEAKAIQDKVVETFDAVVNFPYLGVLSYGVFFVLIFFFAIVAIALLILLLKKE